MTGTAVYGTVRTVVWEDGGGNPASYPILICENYGELFTHESIHVGFVNHAHQACILRLDDDIVVMG